MGSLRAEEDPETDEKPRYMTGRSPHFSPEATCIYLTAVWSNTATYMLLCI